MNWSAGAEKVGSEPSDMRRLGIIPLCLALSVIGAGRSTGANPLIAGCCDSITSEPSYLDLVWDVYGWPAGPDPWEHNLGVDASWSIAGLSRLEGYLAEENPDAVVVLSGTPDSFFDKPEGGSWGPPEGYIESVTVGNIEAMVDATLLDGGEPVLVAPPPVLDNCSGNGALTCGEIDNRLEDLSVALDSLAFEVFNDEVAFVDLWTLFNEHPDIESLYGSDNVHPNHDVGDPYIRDALLASLADILCGNGSLDPGEECDDGNNDAGDGCSATCDIEACLDGFDNDGDGFCDTPAGSCTDGSTAGDPGCATPDDLSERSPLLVCDDGADNDGDGRADFDPVTFANPGDQYTLPAGSGDPGCKDPTWSTESPQCQDGINNDHWGQDPDPGHIDYDGGLSALGYVAAEPDAQCVGNPWKDTERKPGPYYCGLSAELALLLPPLMWLYRRRRRGIWTS